MRKSTWIIVISYIIVTILLFMFGWFYESFQAVSAWADGTKSMVIMGWSVALLLSVLGVIMGETWD